MFNPWGPGIAVERALFDHALRDLARAGGVDVRADAKVVGIEREDGAGWKLSLRLEDDKISSLWRVCCSCHRSRCHIVFRPVGSSGVVDNRLDDITAGSA